MNKALLVICFFSFTLIVKAQTAGFTWQSKNGSFCNPDTIQFTQTSTGNPIGFVWSFGNGESSSGPNPGITYNNAGSYIVKLTVIYPNITLVATKTIMINASITASIGYDRNYICKPGIINFTAAASGNIAGYDWDFGDGLGIETTTANKITHNYLDTGVYNVTLKAKDVSGCVGTDQTTITVQIPGFTGTVSPKSGCVSMNAGFNANVVIPRNSSVTKYTWDFNDGSSTASTTVNNTNHTYIAPGNYSPAVIITTNEGCTNIYRFGKIAFGTLPLNDMAYPLKTPICGSDSASFVSKATTANSYIWDFGDGKTAIATDTITNHKYTTLGTKTITVTSAYNGCNGSPVTFKIKVVGVIATYRCSNSCSDKKTFAFNNISQGNVSFVSWDFGDGSPAENTRNVTHTYSSSGAFDTKLTVTDNITGCSDTYSRTIYTANPALVNADTSVCKNTNTTFSVVNNYDNAAQTYTWNVAGMQVGPFKDSSLTLNATIFGNFNNYVIINNGTSYCQDTIGLSQSFIVRGPDLSFTALPAICLNSLYNVTNTSRPFIPADSVNFWYWNFGVKKENDSIYQPLPYVYDAFGTYQVTLTGVDINGCKDNLVKTITVDQIPFLYVIPRIDSICLGKSATLIAFHTDSIYWSPANSLTCATCDTVVTSTSGNTKYFITASSTLGCTVVDSILVKVISTSFVAFPLLSNSYICLNDTVQLNVGPPGKRIVWSPAAGLSDANNYGPIASPAQATTYTATLTDSLGCFTSSANINVHIKSSPAVDAGPDTAYLFNTSFSLNPLYSNNVSSYSWSPINPLSCNTCPDPNGMAINSNTFFIKVTSDSGCIAKDAITITVKYKDPNILMPTAFTPNNDNLNDYFFPLTQGIKSITRFSIYNRFGKLVYEARDFPPNDKAFGWNGKINNLAQPTSVFVYYVEAIGDSGERLHKKGSVVLIR